MYNITTKMINNIKYYFKKIYEYFGELTYYDEFLMARKNPYFRSNRFDSEDLAYD